jgi:hypothetical protein
MGWPETRWIMMFAIHQRISSRQAGDSSADARHERRMAILLRERGTGWSAIMASIARVRRRVATPVATHVELMSPLRVAMATTGTERDCRHSCRLGDDALDRVRGHVVGLCGQIYECAESAK